MNLPETLIALADARTTASQDIDLAPPMARAGREARVNEAKAAILSLTKEVLKMTKEVSGGIFVEGEGSAEFSAIAEDEGGAVTVDASLMYETIADAVEKTMEQNNSREWRLDIITTLVGNLAGLGAKLGIAYMNPLDTTKYTRALLTDRAATLAMVRDVVRSAVGDDLNALSLQAAIADKVISEECVQAVVPVVVINAHPDDVANLGKLVFNGRYVTATAKENVDQNIVILAFKHLKPLFKR